MRFRPCIDLHAGAVKQIVGSSLKDGEQPKTNFISEKPAAYFGNLYREDGLFGGHVISLGDGNEEAALEALRAFPGGLHYGGGINASNCKKFLDAGASHVIVTSYIFTAGNLDMEKLMQFKDISARLVLDFSCRLGADGRYYVVTDRWQRFTTFEVTKENLVQLASYCAEFLVHGVDVEGKQLGIDEELVKRLGEWSPIPITYAGGVRNINDLELIERLGNGRVDATIGSALDVFGGALPYRSVVEWHNKRQKPIAALPIDAKQ